MSTPELHSTIDGLFLGRVDQTWSRRGASAIAKTSVAEPQEIGEFGFKNDAQADLANHGGRDKAIHHYPADHYPIWISEGEIAEGVVPAAFGENISSLGMTETNLCIGDILKLGTATVQISQGRQPCWKVSRHTGNDKMAYLFQKTGRTGWYYRVLEAGIAGTGDPISLAERIHSDWTVERVTRARLTRRVTAQEAQTLADMRELAAGWREAFQRMANGNVSENTDARLKG